MIKKKIMIIAHFTQGRNEGGNNRFNYIAQRLGAKYTVELVTSSFLHTAKVQRSQGTGAKVADQEVCYATTLIFEPGYKKNVTPGRLYSHHIFGKNLQEYLQKSEKPDLIYCAVPSLSAASHAVKYANKAEIPIVLDVQDLWPEAFEMVLPLPKAAKRILFYPMVRKADWVYRNADHVVTVSDAYCERIRHARTEKEALPTAVYLGTAFSSFDAVSVVEPNIEKTKEKCKVVYTGTLGHSYDLVTVIDALSKADPNNKKFQFTVMGDGPLSEQVKAYAEAKGVPINFTGRLDYFESVGYLKEADIAVNPIQKGAAQSIINKHADYAAAGLPVVSTQETGGYAELLQRYNAGLSYGAGDAEGVAEGLTMLLENETLRKRMGKNSRTLGEQKFNREETYKEIYRLIEEILERQT